MPKARITLTTLYEILQSHTAQLNVIATQLISVEQKQDEHTLLLRSIQGTLDSTLESLNSALESRQN